MCHMWIKKNGGNQGPGCAERGRAAENAFPGQSGPDCGRRDDLGPAAGEGHPPRGCRRFPGGPADPAGIRCYCRQWKRLIHFLCDPETH